MESFTITDAIFKDIRHKDTPDRLDFEISLENGVGDLLEMTADSKRPAIFAFANREFSGILSRKPKKRIYSQAKLTPVDGKPLPEHSTAQTVGGVLHGHFKVPAETNLTLRFSEIREAHGSTLLIEILEPELSPPSTVERPIVESLISSSGAGFGDPEANKLVEKAAMEFVTAHYIGEGWGVSDDPSKKKGPGYDLECKRGSEVQHIEVKGVSGSREEFIITRNEVDTAAKDPNFVLAVVTHAGSKQPELHQYSGPVMLERFELTTIAFAAKPK